MEEVIRAASLDFSFSEFNIPNYREAGAIFEYSAERKGSCR